MPALLQDDDSDDENDDANHVNGRWEEVRIDDVPARDLRNGIQEDFFASLPRFNGQTGPNRTAIRDLGCETPLHFFQLFWTDEVPPRPI